MYIKVDKFCSLYQWREPIFNTNILAWQDVLSRILVGNSWAKVQENYFYLKKIKDSANLSLVLTESYTHRM